MTGGVLLTDPETWAVWASKEDGVCTPGWWHWNPHFRCKLDHCDRVGTCTMVRSGWLHNPVGGPTYDDANDLLALGMCRYEEDPLDQDSDWTFMVEQLVVQGDLPHPGWKWSALL
jgi:hypothetical protein